ncbi:pyridoxal-phosphate dependent enzyme [Streptomyces uncialis]|uniref:pyridoxal-phosphate dependent enzyme n=1 Tax=Streptomyces uncialis TaxID=1048205 RepID=UPI002E34C6E4|nr:pyridoxal-phosphate dependent enzyme [Streptomyces uncialis]
MRRFWLPHGAARTFSNSCTLRNSCMRSYTQLFRTPEFKLSRIALPELEPQDEIWTGQLPGQRLFADSREPGHGPHPLFPADVVDTRRMAWLETCLQSSTCRYMICWVPSRCGHSCDGTHGKVSMLQVERAFDHALCRTPLRRISLSLRGRTARFGLKMEEHGVTGSVKARTAVGLLRELHRQAPLAPGTVVVESTSGNLGLAMAHILPSIDCVFLAVVDLKTPHSTRRELLERGARVIVVDEPDGQGGYLLRRLDTVRRILAEHPEYRWPNQYENPASPRVHEHSTGPEIADQAGPELSAAYAPVSTGGTLAGIAAHLREHRPDVRCVAVDVTGSVAIGGSAGRRLIPGIGASRRSAFLRDGAYDHAVHVDDAEAIAVCRILREDLDVTVGGSTGCVVRALLADLATEAAGGFPVCLAADGGAKYLDTFYSDDWIKEQGIHENVSEAVDRLRADGVAFGWGAARK